MSILSCKRPQTLHTLAGRGGRGRGAGVCSSGVAWVSCGSSMLHMHAARHTCHGMCCLTEHKALCVLNAQTSSMLNTQIWGNEPQTTASTTPRKLCAIQITDDDLLNHFEHVCAPITSSCAMNAAYLSRTSSHGRGCVGQPAHKACLRVLQTPHSFTRSRPRVSRSPVCSSQNMNKTVICFGEALFGN